jgi:hypothetical protein
MAPKTLPLITLVETQAWAKDVVYAPSCFMSIAACEAGAQITNNTPRAGKFVEALTAFEYICTWRT